MLVDQGGALDLHLLPLLAPELLAQDVVDPPEQFGLLELGHRLMGSCVKLLGVFQVVLYSAM